MYDIVSEMVRAVDGAAPVTVKMRRWVWGLQCLGLCLPLALLACWCCQATPLIGLARCGHQHALLLPLHSHRLCSYPWLPLPSSGFCHGILLAVVMAIWLVLTLMPTLASCTLQSPPQPNSTFPHSSLHACCTTPLQRL